MPSEINKKFEAKHLAFIKKAQKQIDAIYRKTIVKIFKETGNLKLKDSIFSISNYPEFNKKVNKFLLSFSYEIDFMLVNGIKGQWELAIEKNAAVIHKSYNKTKIVSEIEKMIYDPHSAALDQFINRRVAGLDLSGRVWKYTNQFRNEIEQNLFVGIQDGKSAAEMARDQIQYLQQPEKLFRRVKDSKGKLQLSKLAKQYKPGKGIYRSSVKNAMRLTRDVVNDSYRQSDMVRYKTLPFILGYDVNLSNNHPKTDMCDDLQGAYPVGFVWLKWHNQCICFCTSRLAKPEEFDKYQEALINGTANKFKFSGIVKSVPDNFTSYVIKNQGKMDNWKRKPDWITNNGIEI